MRIVMIHDSPDVNLVNETRVLWVCYFGMVADKTVTVTTDTLKVLVQDPAQDP